MVQILIPHPDQLHAYITELAARSADKTQKDLSKEYKDWELGKTSMPHEVTWETAMDGVLIRECEASLTAGYSAEHGPWGSFVVLLWTASADKGWQAAQRIDSIRDILQTKGLNARVEVDEMAVYQIQITNADPARTVLFSLGHKTPEEAIAHGEEDTDYREYTSLILQPDDGTLSFDVTVCTRQLQQFQYIAAQAIDALYEAFGLESPRVTVVVDMAYPSTRWVAK